MAKDKVKIEVDGKTIEIMTPDFGTVTLIFHEGKLTLVEELNKTKV